MEELSYFLSSWIGNLGVVPLFLSLAFLFWPALTLLFFLLFSVTAVLETILYLLQTRLIQSGFLPSVKPYVKAGGAILVIFFSFPSTGLANLLISKGEHEELKTPQLTKFTLGNKEVLSAKYLPEKEIILIKGKRLGYSEMRYWNKKGEVHRFGVYVLSKKEQLKLTHIADSLRNLGLEVSFKGPLVHATGTLETASSYKILKEIWQAYHSKVVLQINLSSVLHREFLIELYRSFWDEYIEDVHCQREYVSFQCSYGQGQSLSEGTVHKLKKKFILDILASKNFNSEQNYELHIKLYQLENIFGENIDLGLSQIEAGLHSFYNRDFNSILEKNKIFLSQRKLDLSILVDHKMILQLDRKGTIRMGTESSYNSETKEKITLGWKFSGLKIEMLLKKKGNYYNLKYKTSLTGPHNSKGSISGSHSSSQLSLKEHQVYQLFELGINSNDLSENSFPLLGQIPLLGILFKGKYEGSGHKKVVALIKVSKKE